MRWKIDFAVNRAFRFVTKIVEIHWLLHVEVVYLVIIIYYLYQSYKGDISYGSIKTCCLIVISGNYFCVSK